MFTEHDSIRTNLFGQVNVLAAIVKYWTDNKRPGVITQTSSVNGLRGDPGAALYVASKHGAIGVTKSVALELAAVNPPIRVNTIAPGFVDTSIVWQQCKFLEYGQQSWEGEYITHDHPLWKKYGDEFILASPCGKLVQPKDIGIMVMYLCSEEASYISGATLLVDAGLTSEVVDV